MISVTFTKDEVKLVAPAAYQYDYGQVLEINGLHLSPTVEIDFSADGDEETITMTGTTTAGVTTVDIPDDMFSKKWKWDYVVNAYVYVVDETSGITKKQIRIPVRHREERSEEEPTPAQRSALDEAIAAMAEYSLELDPTLANEGDAADAKATGDAIAAEAAARAAEDADLKSALNQPKITWSIGRYVSSTGSIVGSDGYATRSAITNLIPVQNGDVIDSTNLPSYDENNHGLTCFICTYLNGVFQERVNPYQNRKYTIPSNINGVRFTFNVSTVTMTPEIISSCFIVFFFVKDMPYSQSIKMLENMAYNCTDFLQGVTGVNQTYRGVTFFWNGDGTCYVKGTASDGISYSNFINKSDGLPSGFVVGEKYWFETNAVYAKLQIFPLHDGNIISGTVVEIRNGKGSITIPEAANGLIARVAVENGTSADETIFVRGFNSMTNEELTDLIESGTVVNNYEFVNYENTYNVSAFPSITADTNNYLSATGDNTDMTLAIASMLSSVGVCHLGPGVFYVKNLSMPNGSSLIGSGTATKLRLISGENAYAVKLGSNCLLIDMWILGADEITTSATIGTRHGILWQGTYASDQSAPSRSMISNVKITSFTGGGITCADTGTPIRNYIEVVNAIIHNCNVGINISYSSEFHKFTNVSAQANYYGCINNGGNNIFVNCDFSGCSGVAFLMDNSLSQSPNNSHGSAIGCVFNHTANNTGIGIKVLNCDYGFVFTGCQLFFSQIDIEDSDGVIVSDSNFGDSNCNITIKNGGVVLFSNNLHQTAPTISITNNNNVHFVNCYVRSTGAVVTN